MPVYNTCSTSPTQLKEDELSGYESSDIEHNVKNVYINEDVEKNKLISDISRVLRLFTSDLNIKTDQMILLNVS